MLELHLAPKRDSSLRVPPFDSGRSVHCTPAHLLGCLSLAIALTLFKAILWPSVAAVGRGSRSPCPQHSSLDVSLSDYIIEQSSEKATQALAPNYTHHEVLEAI